MRYLLIFCLVVPRWGFGSVSLNGPDALCDYFAAYASGNAAYTLSLPEAKRFFETHGRRSLSARRYAALTEDLESARPGATLVFNGEEIGRFFGVVPMGYRKAEHVAHAQAYASTHRSVWAVTLALSLLTIGALAYFKVDLGKVTGIPWLGGQGVQVPIGGGISLLAATAFTKWLYGPSFQQFQHDLYDRWQRDTSRGKPSGPISYGHDIAGVDRPSYYSIEIVYAWDKLQDPPHNVSRDEEPVVVVHLTERRRR